MSDIVPPIIFVAFADPSGDGGDWSLPKLQLDQEAKIIRDALACSNCEQNGGWEFQTGSDCKRADLIDHFNTNRVAVFHFAGHSNQQSLWLPSETHGNQVVDGTLFEEYLATQHSLQLAFFNSCVNQDWTSKLMGSIPYVIATVCAVPNDAALTFASSFYNALASEQSFDDAFAQATHAVMTEHENTPVIAQWISQSGKQAPPVRMMDELADAPLDTPAANSAIFPWVALKSRDAAQHPWKLSDIANDPLIGLPPLAQEYYDHLPDCPYVTLKGHTERDAAIFFGRSAEIRALYDWAMESDGSHPVRLFYGQSGVGKSSLLNAGLLPRIRKQCGVAYRRRNQDLVEDLHSAIAEALGITIPAGTPPTLDWWNARAREWLASAKPNLVILDQVEESITHFSEPEKNNARYKRPLDEIEAFAARVKEIFAMCTTCPKARLLLSFRKEYLAEIRGCFANGAADDSPELVDHFWLDRLSRDEIVQAVTGAANSRLTRGKYKIVFHDTDLPSTIAEELLEGDSPVATVLQILLNALWDAAKPDANGVRTYSAALYFHLALRKNPLQEFYDQQIRELDKKDERHSYDQGLELQLLFEHTTDLGTSKNCSLKYLKENFPQFPDLEELITANKDLYLLADPATKPGAEEGAEQYETVLAHDTLAPLVRRSFEYSLLPAVRARRILEGRTREWPHDKKLALLDRAELHAVKHGMRQMRKMTPAEERLLKASRRHHLRSTLTTLAAVVLAPLLLIGMVLMLIVMQWNSLKLVVADTTHNLNQDGLLALSYALDAERIRESSWEMKLFQHKSLDQQILTNLNQALMTREVYRLEIGTGSNHLGACAATLDAQGRPLLSLGGAKDAAFFLNGKQVPDGLFSDSATACDAASETIAFLRNAPNAAAGQYEPMNEIFVWRKGQLQTIPLSVPDGAGLVPRHLALAPGGKMLAFGLDGASRHELGLLNLASGQLTVLPNVTVDGTLTFSPSGQYLIDAGSGLSAADLSAAQPVFTPIVDSGLGGYGLGSINGQDVVAYSARNEISLYRLTDGSQFHYQPSAQDAQIRGIALAPSGKLLATDTSGRIDLWAVPVNFGRGDATAAIPAARGPQRRMALQQQRQEQRAEKRQEQQVQKQQGQQASQFPLYMNFFRASDTTAAYHVFNPKATLLATVEFHMPPSSPFEQNTDLTPLAGHLHVWKVQPYNPAQLSKEIPERLFRTGCTNIGNYIATMASEPSTVRAFPNLDYGVLKKACHARLSEK